MMRKGCRAAVATALEIFPAAPLQPRPLAVAAPCTHTHTIIREDNEYLET